VLLQVLPERGVVCALQNVDQGMNLCAVLDLRSLFAVVQMSLVLLSNRIERPIYRLQSISKVESTEINFDVFDGPQLFQHGKQLLFDIDIIVKAKFNFLLSLYNFLVLVLEYYRTEVVEFGQEGDQLFVFLYVETLEEVGENYIVVFYQFRVDCGVEW
jgi:hypothetical protein